jgi:hypothetical protein
MTNHHYLRVGCHNLFDWLHVISQAEKEMVYGWLNEYILH